MYSGLKLSELLAKKHEQPQLLGLFQQGTFTLEWRAKVGSFPHPDLETIVSAGDPCGTWKPSQGRPEDKREVGKNWEQLRTLPLNGYIPGSSIRGLVRAWAKQRPEIKSRMYQLLGYQEEEIINAGKIEFLDAWPSQPIRLSLDIVNPQEPFQVFHRGQSTPLSLYTLGDGEKPITVTVAIRGIPGKATPDEVQEVWGWVEQALGLYGVGSRTASGYGSFKRPRTFELDPDPNYAVKQFDFTLYSQGSAGPNLEKMELRPSHWRGWLRSWVLRFLLGVMSKEDAQRTVSELFGTIEPESRKGCVRLQMLKGKTWGDRSEQPYFYTWKGTIAISAPQEILNCVILPIIKFAISVGGVGRGWRRPLHIFRTDRGYQAARGTHLILTDTIKNKETGKNEKKLYGLHPNKPQLWIKTYETWLSAIQKNWLKRISLNSNKTLMAEVFSPHTCTIYVVPAPVEEPINRNNGSWEVTEPLDTRGEGINLIYQNKYKRKQDVGGNAAGGGNSHCSWVSIKRVNVPNQEEDTDCQEIVCLFMAGQSPAENGLRSQFLTDLARCNGAIHLFGVKPEN